MIITNSEQLDSQDKPLKVMGHKTVVSDMSLSQFKNEKSIRNLQKKQGRSSIHGTAQSHENLSSSMGDAQKELKVETSDDSSIEGLRNIVKGRDSMQDL